MVAEQSSDPERAGTGGAVEVELDRRHRTAVVSFARGDHNYLTYEFLEQLLNVLEELRSPDCRAIVLRTGSRHFSAGADFRAGRPSEPGGPNVFDLVPRFHSLAVPVVAAVRGAAIGAGLGLALAADFRVATPRAYFLTNFNRIGITPGFGLSLTLPRLVGSQRAADMFLTARRIAGAEALAFGLCDRLVEEDRLDQEVLSFAQEIALCSPHAVAETRRALRGDLVERLQATLNQERATQSAFLDSEEFKEGVRAWNEKRPPEFDQSTIEEQQ